MAAIHKLNRKKQSDRRTALLGVAADRPEFTGACLMPEEMAQLVENKFPQKIKEQYLRHVASCDECYREWLTLHEVLGKISEDKKIQRVIKMLKPGKIALFGTFLAAAASVVIFLNITNIVTEKAGSPPGIILQEERQVEDKDGRNSVKSAIKSEGLTKKKKPHVVNDAVGIKKKKLAPAAPAVISPAPASAPKEEPSVQRSFSAEQALPNTSGEGVTQKAINSRAGNGLPIPQHYRGQIGTVVFGQWLGQLENGCTERQESEVFWREIEQEGRQLQARAGELNQSEKQILETLLSLTVGIEKKNVPERCRRIMDLLAEKRTNR